MPLSAKQYELLETLGKTSSSGFWTNEQTLRRSPPSARTSGPGPAS